MPSYQLAGEILAEAFLHYRLMRYAFEGRSEDDFKKRVLYLYTHCAKAAAKYGGVIITPDKQGSVIWLNGHNFPLGLIKEVKAGMAALPFKLGAKSTLRLMNHDAVPEGWIKQNASAKMGYIWCIGVKQQARGKGYARQLIDEAIAHMRAQGMDEFWLKTEDEKNVAIYKQLGFALMLETTVKSSGLKSWVFKKMNV